MQPDFGASNLLTWLEQATPAMIDALPYGVISMARGGVVLHYNRTEAAMAGLSPDRLLGRNFFETVGLCTNNHLVAGRFEAEAELDATIDYVFTLRMAVTPVRLRLLQHPDAARIYLLVERRPQS